jgi:hypothetical protein
MSPLLLLPLLLAQTHTRWEASVRTEVRARNALAGNATEVTAADFEVRPHLAAALFSGAWTLSGNYTPSIRVREPYIVQRTDKWVDHSHILQLDGSWAREGSPRPFIGEYLSYGTIDLSTVNRSGAPLSPEAIPLLGQVRELTTDTSAGIDWPLSRAMTLTTSAGYLYGGGADPLSRQTLPLQSSPRGLARLAWQATRLDTAALNALVRFTSFETGAQITLGELFSTYARLLGPDTTLDFTAGAAGAWGAIPGEDNLLHVQAGFMPMGGAGISHRIQLRGQRWDFHLGALAAPFIDRFLGTIYERIEGNGTLGWGNAQRVYAYLRTGVSQSLGSGREAGLFTGYGEAGIGYVGEQQWWRVDLSGREALLKGAPPVVAAGEPVPAPTGWQSQWVIGLSATFIALSAPQPAVAE